MPMQDKTGPKGAGPKTGRGLGDCKSLSTSTGRRVGRGLGRKVGRGLGRGRQK